MAMTSVDVDSDVLDQASKVLGTTTKKDTINQALSEVLRMHAASQLMEILQSDAVEITDPDELHDRAWGYSAGRQAA